MTEPKHEMLTKEQVAARKKSKSQNPHHPHLGVGHFGVARFNRPALPMRDVQTAGKTENCRVLREEYSVCRKMAKRFAGPRFRFKQYPPRRRLLQMYVGAAFGQIERETD